MIPSSFPFVDEFFNTGAEKDCMVIHEDNSAFECKVHFENEFAAQAVQDVIFEGNNPVMLCRTIDADNIKQKDRVIINNKNYRVSERHPDGEGLTFIILIND